MRYFLPILALLFIVPSSVFAYVSPGSPDGYVTDFAEILSPETETLLESELLQFTASTTIEVAVVTVSSLDGDDVAVYANELFREWGIGKKETDNGLLLLVAPNERKMRIEVGYGLEGVVPDITAGQIIDELITPAFKLGDYDGGVIAGVQALERVAEGEVFVSSTQSTNPLLDLIGTAFGVGMFGMFGIIFLSQFLMLLAAILSRSKSWWFGGVAGVGLGMFLFYMTESLLVGITASIILGVLGALYDYFVSKIYKEHVDHGLTPPWYIGGGRSGSGWGGGSSGGGGFSGGSSGGGGASGSW